MYLQSDACALLSREAGVATPSAALGDAVQRHASASDGWRASLRAVE